MDETINKVYDLLELVYVELQKTKTELQDGFDKGIHSLRYELKTDIADLRTELKSDMAEFRQDVNTRFDTLEDLVNKHDVEIKVIKAAK
jgi:hypothetical protein